MKDVCKLNADLTATFEQRSIAQIKRKEDEDRLHKDRIDAYAEETREIIYLLSGCVDVNSESFKKYSIAGVNPNWFRVHTLMTMVGFLKHEKLHGITTITDWGQVCYYAGNLSYPLKDLCVTNEYLKYYVDKHCLENLKEFTGRDYVLEYHDDSMCLVAKDETVMEYTSRMRCGYPWLIALIPFVGQLWLLCMLWYFVKGLFTKPWSRNNAS